MRSLGMMIGLRRTDERQCVRGEKQQAWLTFCPQGHPAAGGDGTVSDGFGDLESLTERRLSPDATVRHGLADLEIVTYVREGALALEDATGRSGLLAAGEFQRLTLGRGLRYTESNASHCDEAHVFQVGLRCTEVGDDASLEQKRFSAAERRGRLCLIASPDRSLTTSGADSRSLRLRQDARVFSAVLDRGQHLIHELAFGRSAWLHVVHGEVDFGDTVLVAGDGAGITEERGVSFTARTATEILLVDVKEAPPRVWSSGDAPRRYPAR